MNPIIQSALERACAEAERFRGATAPNPPVGAVALDSEGSILYAAAHEKAGEAHAEARVIAELKSKGLLNQIHTMVVTLEPCNHHGKTPPCADALLALPSLKRVFFAASDPNPEAQGGGAKLSQHGIESDCLADSAPSHPSVHRAIKLTQPFFHWIKTGKPWVTVKTAWRKMPDGSLTMIPPRGSKTFTSPSSLRLAHELRKRADAIVTGSGTVLADRPLFTVREIPDHPGKRRWLGIMDRRRRTPSDWIEGRRNDGFQIVFRDDFSSLLEFFGSQGVLEVLVEAGPTLSDFVLSTGLWNEHVKIISNPEGHESNDQVKIDLNSQREFKNVHGNY